MKREWKGKEGRWRCELEPRGRLFVLNMEDIDEFLVMASDKEYSRLPLKGECFSRYIFRLHLSNGQKCPFFLTFSIDNCNCLC